MYFLLKYSWRSLSDCHGPDTVLNIYALSHLFIISNIGGRELCSARLFYISGLLALILSNNLDPQSFKFHHNSSYSLGCVSDCWNGPVTWPVVYSRNTPTVCLSLAEWRGYPHRGCKNDMGFGKSCKLLNKENKGCTWNSMIGSSLTRNKSNHYNWMKTIWKRIAIIKWNLITILKFLCFLLM